MMNPWPQSITTVSIFIYYDVNKVTIQCGQKGLGATLLQKGQFVAFAFRSLSVTEHQHAQIEKECLAIVFACERNQYIYG